MSDCAVIELHSSVERCHGVYVKIRTAKIYRVFLKERREKKKVDEMHTICLSGMGNKDRETTRP